MIRRGTPKPVAAQADDGAAFEQEQRNSARLSFQMRVLALAIIAVALAVRLDGLALTFYLAVSVVLLANGALIQFLLRFLASRRPITANLVCAALIAVDMGLITTALVMPTPGSPEAWTAEMQLRVGNVGFLFVFLVFSSLSYSAHWWASTTTVSIRCNCFITPSPTRKR